MENKENAASPTEARANGTATGNQESTLLAMLRRMRNNDGLVEAKGILTGILKDMEEVEKPQTKQDESNEKHQSQDL